MGLRITRARRCTYPSLADRSDGIDSLWSARGLCCAESAPATPTIVKRIEPNGTGHLGREHVKRVFDWLWEATRDRVGAVVELDMARVSSVDSRFARELEFLRRQLRRQGGEIRIRSGVRDWGNERGSLVGGAAREFDTRRPHVKQHFTVLSYCKGAPQ